MFGAGIITIAVVAAAMCAHGRADTATGDIATATGPDGARTGMGRGGIIVIAAAFATRIAGLGAIAMAAGADSASISASKPTVRQRRSKKHMFCQGVGQICDRHPDVT